MKITKIMQSNKNINSILVSFSLLILIAIVILQTFRPQQKDVLGLHNGYEGYKQFTPKFYVGVDVDMSQLLPSSKYYIVNNKGEDLTDIAARLVINTFRIMNYTKESKYSYTVQEWDSVLRKMNSKRIKAIILMESPIWTEPVHEPTVFQTAMDLVKSYVLTPDLCNNPDVFAIDLLNEADLTIDNLNMLSEEKKVIKKQCPQTLITVGGWKVDTNKKDLGGKEMYDYNNPKDSRLIKNIVDIYAPHIYGFDKKDKNKFPDPFVLIKNYIMALNKYGGNKSIFFEEFGAANGQAVSDLNTLGSKELQANVYEGVLHAAYSQHTMGATAYIFYPRSSDPESWNILTDNGNVILPAANVLQKYATGTSDIPLTLPFVSVPNDYLFTNTDDGKIITVHPNDIIAFSLALDSSYNYALVKNGTAIFTTTENLTYVSEPKKYYAVLHATNPGKTQIIVNRTDTALQVFSLTLIVQ